MDTALRALNRFGLGARPGEAPRLSDPRGWLESQLDGPPPVRDAPDGRGDAGELLTAQREAARNADPEAREAVRRRLRTHTAAEAGDALEARVSAERPFVERWVAFWSNHLCVSAAGKLPVGLLAGAYEREAIRPHVLGRFDDLVLASARHPAMLLYLDNAQSVGPDSRAVRGAARRRGRGSAGGDARPPLGLNENYARELLELHTVGVEGGYGQDDVRQLARILTGWTVRGVGPAARFVGAGTGGARADAGIDFAFAPLLHEPGAKTVLGRRYGEDGEREGVAVIRDLCRHPATARFVASKVVRHFVSDAPSEASVEAVVRVFRDSDGDLREVARAVVRLDEAWDPETVKFRTPQDWLVAMLRGAGADDAPPAVLGVLQGLRQPLWAPPSPKGYGDTVADWADPDALMNRAELARTVARTVVGRGRGASRPGAGRPGAAAPRGAAPRRPLAPAAPSGLAALAALVDRPADDPLPGLLADDSIPVDERMALAFAGPAFQWR